MQINNYKNSISFSSLNCPIKPFIIKTSKGSLYCREIDYKENHAECFYKNISQFFLDIFANTSSHPFWKKCRKPTLDRQVYDNYVKSNINECKIFFQDSDTTVILATDENNQLAGAIYARTLNLNKQLKDSRTIYIDGLAVSPKYRGQNVGKELLTKVLEASKTKFSDAFLVAYKESTRFYEKLKFHKMDRNDFAQKYAIEQLKHERVDYPNYADLMQRKLDTTSDKWYERIEKSNT